MFSFAGHNSSIQEDTQIHLWKTRARIQTGLLRQAGKCVCVDEMHCTNLISPPSSQHLTNICQLWYFLASFFHHQPTKSAWSSSSGPRLGFHSVVSVPRRVLTLKSRSAVSWLDSVSHTESNPNTSSNPVFLSGHHVPVKAAGMKLSE